MFTFLHAADIHLDSPLRGLDRYEGAPVEEIRGASRRALSNLVELAIRESVTFVIVAGDLYDGDWKDFDTGLFFANQMSRLREAGIPVFGVQGNHDASSKITRSLRLPPNVHFFSTAAAETRHLAELNIAIHGQSFASQCTAADLAKNYPAAVPGCFNLGVLHTSMNGRDGHGSYAPCSEACLRDSGYDYWALGHIHQREVLPGQPTIAFPGNIQGRHARETGPKGCLRVHVDDRSVVTTEFEPLDVLRWAVVTVSLDGVWERNKALDRIDEALRGLVEESQGRLMATRLKLTGTTPLALDIAANPRQWSADVRATALDISSDRLWIEKIKSETTAQHVSHATGGDDTPIAEVAAIVAELIESEEAASDLGVDFTDLERKLPVEIKDVLSSSDAQWWGRILREAEAKLLSELKG
jgi:DNA repair exonuclease SbcCD nuclease subunit